MSIVRKKKDMPDAERVFTLQSKLYQKAKQDKQYKFYVLYDKMFLKQIFRKTHLVLDPKGVPEMQWEKSRRT